MPECCSEIPAPKSRRKLVFPYATIETAEIESGIGNHPRRFLADPDRKKFGFEEEDRLFVDAALAGGAPPVTAFDGYRAVELVAACYRSASENQRVTI